jgi:hypothetical protein
MEGDDDFKNLMVFVAAQIDTYEKREKSRVEKHYSDAMQRSAIALAQYARTAPFDQLIRVEKTFQENDLVVYAKRPATMKAVQEGIEDLEEGETAYKQLLENTEAYRAHGYRKKERASPEKVIPLDAMRRALRGQVKRVENYRSNVMGNSQEQEFMSARIAMLRRAEKLYDAIQREHLLPPDSGV